MINMSCIYSLSSSFLPSNALNLTAIVEPAMQSFTSLVLVSALAAQAIFAAPDPSFSTRGKTDIVKRTVDSFITTESPIALADLLCNIGATGHCASGAASGVVVASPDKTNPDCRQRPLFALTTGCSLPYALLHHSPSSDY